MAIVEVKNLSKTFDAAGGTTTALNHINLSIEEGDVFGIIGMSGAGKSTLVRCLNLLEVPTEGQVIVEGKDLTALTNKELREERGRIAMIFQSFNLLQQKNVISNVCVPMMIQGKKKSEAKKRAKELLELVCLQDKARSYPSQLSGGQCQRVAIARALASDPKILLCDEATSALDPQTTNQILDLLKEINQKLKITIIIITHQMSVVQKICNRVAIIDHGEIAEMGEVEEIFTHPKSQAGRVLVIDGTQEVGTSDRQKAVELLKEKKRIRIVFSKNSSYEPVIANMVLAVGKPVNILKADTQDVGGVARGQMILGLPDDADAQEKMIAYLKDHNLAVEEVQA